MQEARGLDCLLSKCVISILAYQRMCLMHKMYGPSVMPWQPDGIWLSPYNGATMDSVSNGEDQYRQGHLYILETYCTLSFHDCIRWRAKRMYAMRGGSGPILHCRHLVR